jgi:hypothetical protein
VFRCHDAGGEQVEGAVNHSGLVGGDRLVGARIAVPRPDAHIGAMRAVLGDLMEDPGTAERLVDMLQALTINYDVGSESHPLIVRRDRHGAGPHVYWDR